MHSGYNCEGYFDQYNLSGDQLATLKDDVVKKRERMSTLSGTKRRYEFAITPNFGFLASPEPLLKNCELKLSFDRSNWKTAITEYETVTNACTKIEIDDCHAVTEYVSSPSMREYFSYIENDPIVYNYEECDIIIKSIPQNTAEIRFDNLKGGNIPKYLFIGVCPTSYLNGNKDISSTLFTHNGVEEVDITLNGNSVNGYPIQIKSNNPVYPMQKFLDVTGRLYDNTVGNTIDIHAFTFNWIWSHKSEAENTSHGWTGISLKLGSAYTSDMSLVAWFIKDTALSIDKYHQIEMLNL